MRRTMRCLALLLLLAPLAGGQATILVPEDYPTIQEGLDQALPGDTVKVGPGIYNEQVHLREDVSLQGSGWRRTIIDAQGAGDVVIATGIHQFSLTKMTLRGSKTVGNLAAAVSIRGSAATTWSLTALIQGCRIVDNGHGIVMNEVHAGTLTIDSNTIDRNQGNAIDPFIGNTVVTSNTIVDNGGSGIVAVDGSGLVTVNSNVICFNDGDAIVRTAGSPMNISYNDVYGNGDDYVEIVSGQPAAFVPQPGTGEMSVLPGFVSLENGDYNVPLSSPLIDAGDPALGLDADGSLPDVGSHTYNLFYVPASTSFGTGCGPTAGWFWEPLLGQPYFESHLKGAPPAAPAILMVGVTNVLWSGIPLPLDLTAFGAIDCQLLTGPVLTFNGATDGLGASQANLVIPDDGALLGAVLYHQWMVPSPGANPLGLVFSDGVASTIKL